MSTHDIVVIGAGPAGAEAAIAARSFGLDVLVLDEAADAGGQVYRIGPESKASSGEILRQRLTESGAQLAFGYRVWTLSKTSSGFRIAAVGSSSTIVAEASAVIVASGAIERFYPRPGWTLPGVIGLGAATVMMKTYGVLPGRRVLVAGPGPLAPLVAHLVQQYGGKVVALSDPNPRHVWLKALPAIASRPSLLLEGARWITSLRAKGVPVIYEWRIRSIEGTDHAEHVRLVRGARERRFDVDAVCFGDGLFPSTEIYRLLGAEIVYRPERGGWVPKLDTGQRTTIPKLYAAGDGAELLGVAAAPLTGRIAALAAARDLGKITESEYHGGWTAARDHLGRVSRFGRAFAQMMRPRSWTVKEVSDNTIVCRCDDVTAGQIRNAVAEGASEINALKAATRCGMGPCGGRMCGEAAAALMECSGINRESVGYWTARPPLRPVPISALTGRFDYADIPVREPAPL
jgi:thioredoxin reductase/bacterioferritin-associated ferredoxin